MALKICSHGHQFHKSSSCPVCPVCEKARKPIAGFYANLPAPARRAMESKGITTLEKLSTFSEKEILALHGVGKTTIPRLKTALNHAGLDFKAEG